MGRTKSSPEPATPATDAVPARKSSPSKVSERMKRRLAGAVILVSLAVVFLPGLLDRPKNYEPTPIPFPVKPEAPAPAAATLPAKELAIPPLVPRSGTSSAPVAAVVAPRAAAAPPRAAAEPSKPISAWAVQVAALSNRDKAERLQAELKRQGFPAFVETSRTGDQEHFRVRVGPEADRVRAERLAVEIEKKLKQKGQVIHYP